jgi:hypothetical protein
MDALPAGMWQKALALNPDKAKYGTIATSVSSLTWLSAERSRVVQGAREKKALLFTSETG